MFTHLVFPAAAPQRELHEAPRPRIFRHAIAPTPSDEGATVEKTLYHLKDGGTSGGPWLEGIDESNGSGGTLSSVNSYRYSGGDSIYGPKFNSTTQATYNAANGATSNTIVP